jgi:hypothetical protein
MIEISFVSLHSARRSLALVQKIKINSVDAETLETAFYPLLAIPSVTHHTEKLS